MRCCLVLICLVGFTGCATGTVDKFSEGGNSPIAPKGPLVSTEKSDTIDGPNNILPPREQQTQSTDCASNGPFNPNCTNPCDPNTTQCGEAPTPAQSTDSDVCADEMLYADGPCDENCAFIDRDCGPPADCATDPTSQSRPECTVWEPGGHLTEQEVTLCGRLNLDETPVHELATSLCIERTGQDFSDCIADCVSAYFQSNQ